MNTRPRASSTSASVEIERKFLVTRWPPGTQPQSVVLIRQGYLAIESDGTEVRVRAKGDQHSLTVKAGQGKVRAEREVALTARQFAALWPMTAGRRILKKRYLVSHVECLIEVDEFRGRLKGLILAEVEFPSRKASRFFAAPAWLGREVTIDPAYSNQRLACFGAPGAGRRQAS